MLTLSTHIDELNDRFQAGVLEVLIDVSEYSVKSLEWLVGEHYQFSFANQKLLQIGIGVTRLLKIRGVSEELQRNHDEESGHAVMYREGMRQVGFNVDLRDHYQPTDEFLERISLLIASSPSAALGALYATETAAIFEHERFFDICREICVQHGATWEGSLIKRFHDIHLEDGVEQGHKDGLELFINQAVECGATDDIIRDEVGQAAARAIEMMESWWLSIIKQARSISEVTP